MPRPLHAGIAALLLYCAGWTAAGQPAAATPRLAYPNGLALDVQGNLYISDIGTHQVLKLARDGRLSLVAGTGDGGYSGDGGPATSARLFAPHGVAVDREGRILVADTFNHRVRRIDTHGIITTVAGVGAAAYAGDGGPASAASLNGPQDVLVDRDGRILVADTYNHVVRRIGADGVIVSVAGPGPGLSGDGGLAVKAQISLPSALAVAPDAAVYVSEVGNSRIRRVAPDGTIQTFAGFGLGNGLAGAGFLGDGGPPAKAKLFSAAGLFCDASGRLYISDTGNNRVRIVRDDVISTIVGAGDIGFGGDGGAPAAALLNTPQKIVVDGTGRLFIADRGNGRVRALDAGGVIRTVAGGGRPPGIIVPVEHGQR